jgi:hypothetical protein
MGASGRKQRSQVVRVRRAAWADEQRRHPGRPLVRLEITTDGLVVRRGGMDEQFGWSDVRYLVRCGGAVQWTVLLVMRDGRSWAVWSPRALRAMRAATAPDLWWRRERQFFVWRQRRRFQTMTSPGCEAGSSPT